MILAWLVMVNCLKGKMTVEDTGAGNGAALFAPCFMPDSQALYAGQGLTIEKINGPGIPTWSVRRSELEGDIRAIGHGLVPVRA